MTKSKAAVDAAPTPLQQLQDLLQQIQEGDPPPDPSATIVAVINILIAMQPPAT